MDKLYLARIRLVAVEAQAYTAMRSTIDRAKAEYAMAVSKAELEYCADCKAIQGARPKLKGKAGKARNR